MQKIRSQHTDIWTMRITYVLTHFMNWFSAHWLLLANLAIAFFIGLPILAPVLMHTGHTRAGNLIYLLFRPLCHQLPERSFFLYGVSWAYPSQELIRLLGKLPTQRWVGNGYLGFKIAICQRCVAIYLSVLLGGGLFIGIRNHLRPLPIKAFGIAIVPLAVDGLGQLFGLWASSWVSRIGTGGLFGLACVWFAYPYLELGMREIHKEASKSLKDWIGEQE